MNGKRLKAYIRGKIIAYASKKKREDMKLENELGQVKGIVRQFFKPALSKNLQNEI